MFDCRFQWWPETLRDDEPYFLFEDQGSDPFTRTLIEAVRGAGSRLGVVDAPATFVGSTAPVYMDTPTWTRRHAELIAAGVRGDRARPLLHFESDPTGYWDFAKSCGAELARIFATRRLDRAALGTLQAYLERWLGARALDDRLAPMPAFTVRDYRGLASAHMLEISRVLANLADDESRATYTRMLFGDNEDVLGAFVEKVFGPQQYMEIVKLKPGDVVVNCGVHDGWEIPYFMAMTQGRGRIFNFDPTISWEKTAYADFISRSRDMLEEHKIILGSSDGVVEMPISAANMIRSDEVGQAMAASGTPTVSLTSRRLDTLAHEGMFDRIDYLKMDVEGGEREILRGGLAAIRRFRPKMAIAIYHEPQHFWEYPNLLIDQLEGYRYYVRQYGYSRFETLLYAVPEEDVDSVSGAEGLRRSIFRTPDSPDAWATAYLRDRSARDLYYGGGRRQLTRVCGPTLSRARLEPGVQIDIDDVIAVFETGASATILARHTSDERAQILLARSSGPVDLEWIHVQGLGAGHVCVPAPDAAGEPGYAIVSAEEERAWIYAIDGADVTPLQTIELSGEPPLFIQRIDGGLLTLSLAAERLIQRRYDGQGGYVTESALSLDAEFVGLGAVRRDGPDCPPEQAVVVRHDGVLSFLDGAGRRLAQWVDDDRFAVTSTFAMGARPLLLAPPAGTP